ncbi:MAG TPA: hemerythrin domain-containing protein [Nocardioidaceae bacterium]|nr:hemerythrin domain-containing protein [Nocardioidaceae bacterium]
MAKISMNKAIHGAVRRDLRRFLGALDAFPDGSHPRARQLARAWANFDDQLTDHHESEHEIVWPALGAIGASPEQIAAMDAEHEVVSAAVAVVRTAMSSLATSASAADALAAKVAMTRLQEVALAHFDHEERELEPISSAHRDAPEVHDIAKRFGKRLTPAKGGRFIAWVLDGASADEKAAVTREIPGPVVKIIGGIFGMPYRRKTAPVWKTQR